MLASLLPPLAASSHDDDLFAGFTSPCSSCGGPLEPRQRGAAVWWRCPRCGLSRVA